MPKPAATPATLEPITCPFTVVVDTREQAAFQFVGFTHESGNRRRSLIVPTMRATLTTGDYSIFGHPGISIERKSKADLYGSIVKRENFIGRLERMSELAYSAVVIESEWSDILTNPPIYTKYKPKSLSRTIIAFSIRYPSVQWWFMPGRQAAEGITFRLLQRYYLDRTAELGDVADNV